MARCPLVESFPTEFASVKMTDIQNSGDLDQRAFRGEVVPVALLFGVLCAVLRKNVKASERENYASLIEAVNSIKMGTETERQRSPRGPVVEPEPPKQNVDVSLQRNEIKLKLRIENVEEENIKLKASLEEAFEQLKTLRDEAQKTDCSPPSTTANAKSEEFQDDSVWTLISDVREKYQVPLASAIAGQVHNPKVAKMLSDVAEKLVEKSGPKQAFEVMLGDSAPDFFQSLRVPDWTLLYFKLQSRIPDQGWQTMLSLTRLGRTGVGDYLFFIVLE